MNNRARLITRRIRAHAAAVASGLHTRARQTQQRDIYKPIRVSPLTAQTLAWIRADEGIDYQIVTELDWWLE